MLTKAEMIWIATKAFDKKWEYAELMYSDSMYDHGSETDLVWEYVTEIEDIGTTAFKEKYKEFKMYF